MSKKKDDESMKRNPIAAQLHSGFYKKKVVADKKRKASKQACRKSKGDE